RTANQLVAQLLAATFQLGGSPPLRLNPMAALHGGKMRRSIQYWRAGLVALVVATTMTTGVVAGKITYPECDGGDGCCTFGTGKMRSPGYIVVKLEADTIVTCAKGTLQCFRGNPNLRAAQDGRQEITCPDFTELMESRDSSFATIDGMKDAAGVVKAPDVKRTHASAALLVVVLAMAVAAATAAVAAAGSAQQAAATNSTTSANHETSPPEHHMGKVDLDQLFGTPDGVRSARDLEVAPTLVSIVAMAVGVVVCVAGSSWFRGVALVTSFLNGAFVSILVAERVLPQTEWERALSWVCFCLGGLVFCAIAARFLATVGTFVVGMSAGFLAAFACQLSFGYRWSPAHPTRALVGLLVGLGLLGGWLSLRHACIAKIGATSWIGANTLIWGLGYFIGGFPNGAAIDNFRTSAHKDSDKLTASDYHLPTLWWTYLGAIVVCTIAGALCQILVASCRKHQDQGMLGYHHHIDLEDPSNGTIHVKDTAPRAQTD
ncbi:TPA: hypothetical protein N0F65_003193, partial [Lagenidium giganteum]